MLNQFFQSRILNQDIKRPAQASIQIADKHTKL